jgi:hypothetical protein
MISWLEAIAPNLEMRSKPGHYLPSASIDRYVFVLGSNSLQICNRDDLVGLLVLHLCTHGSVDLIKTKGSQREVNATTKSDAEERRCDCLPGNSFTTSFQQVCSVDSSPGSPVYTLASAGYSCLICSTSVGDAFDILALRLKS